MSRKRSTLIALIALAVAGLAALPFVSESTGFVIVLGLAFLAAFIVGAVRSLKRDRPGSSRT